MRQTFYEIDNENDGTPEDSIKWGFADAVMSVLMGDGDKKAKLAKVKALLDAEEKAMGALAVDDGENFAEQITGVAAGKTRRLSEMARGLPHSGTSFANALTTD